MMLMFIMHIASLLALSVLLASTGFIIWSLRNKGIGSRLGKAVGSAVFFLSLFSLLCIGYYSVKYWAQGRFETAMGMPMHMPMGMHHEMMEKMMPQMMEKMMPQMMEKMMPQMMGNMGKMGEAEPQKEEDHASHYPK